MTKKETKVQSDKTASKKATVLGTRKTKRLPLMMGIGVCFVFMTALAAFYLTQGKNTTTAVASGPLSIDGTAVTFSARMFDDGQARHFEHVDGSHTIRYFILKSSDGILRAAFDACDVCWPSNKGYVQEGDTMVCRNCGRRFASVLINEVKGGCNPAPLKRQIVGDKLVVQIKDIQQGRQYFNFDEKG